MHSLFYKARFERPVAVSFLLIERVAALLRVDQKAAESDPEYVTACVMQALTEILPDKISQAQLDYVMKRLVELTKQAEEKGDTKPKGAVKPGFATSYVAWAEALDPTGICLLAAAYDLPAATKLYETIDREDVLDLVERRLKQEWEQIKVGFESSAYAFGGGYKDDKGGGPDDNVVDLTKDSKANKAALAACKF